MDYTTEMYEEDKRISLSVFKKKFNFKQRLKDDLVQTSLIALYRFRQNRYDEIKGKYFTVAFLVSYHAMLSYIMREKKRTNDFNLLSLDFECQDNDPLEYYIGEQQDFDKNLRYEQLLSVCNKVIEKKGRNFKHIAREFMQGKSPGKIAKDMGVSRQYVYNQLVQIKRLVKEKLLKMGYEI